MSKLSTMFSRFKRRWEIDVLEPKILSGQRIKPITKDPSVLFFTIHKAASTYVNQVLRDVLAAAKYQHIDLYGYSFRNNDKKPDIRDEHFFSRGLYYGALRQPIEIAGEKKCKTIVQVRDPRDVITSYYFSHCYSHALPNNEDRKQRFESVRQNMREMGIDEYAVNHHARTQQSLQTYAVKFFTRPDVLVVHYEDMVNEFPQWLDRIVEYLEIRRTRKLRQAIATVIDKANFDVGREDIFRHKRQVTPGDHLRKLKPETIKFLNREFRSYFEKMAETGNLPASYRLPDLTFQELPSDRAVA